MSINSIRMTKVTIDEKECTGCGLCYNDECPDVFMEGDDGTSSLQEKFRKGGPALGEIPDNLKDCAVQAADACPVSAIVVN
jgi:ferredoxin